MRKKKVSLFRLIALVQQSAVVVDLPSGMASVAAAAGLSSIHQKVHPDEDYVHQEVRRKGPVIQWAIENFSHWYSAADSCNVTSGQFAVADGTHWRMCLTRTLKPVLVRDSIEKGPARVTVGFQFSLLADTQEHFRSEPKTLTFLDGTQHAGDWGLDADDLFQRKDLFLPRDTFILQCHLWRDNHSGPSSRECSVTVRLRTVNSSAHNWFVLFNRKKSRSSSFTFPKSYDSPSPEESIGHPIALYYSQILDGLGESMLKVRHTRNGSTMLKSRWVLLDTAGQMTEKKSRVMFDHFNEKDQYGKTMWAIEREYLLQQKKNVLRDKGDARIRWEAIYSSSEGIQPKYRSQDRHYTRRHRLTVGSSLSTDMRRLLSASDGCPGDMSVVSGDGVSLHVHRDVLGARSAVFAAMLERDMSERQTGQVLISDMCGSTLEQFVSFIYTGQLEEEAALDFDTLVGLYAAGDKYGVFSLKKRCSGLLRAHVSMENACDLMEFSDLHVDCEMRGPIVDTLSKHTEFFVSEEWCDLKGRKRKLAEDVLDAVSLRKRKK